jgi:hypothetical protein
MKYALFEHGNLIREFKTEHDARVSLSRLVREQPDAAEMVLLLGFGPDGLARGRAVTWHEIRAQAIANLEPQAAEDEFPWPILEGVPTTTALKRRLAKAFATKPAFAA